MKILITGTAGFIGFHLAEQLLNFGHEVVGIDMVNDYYETKLKKDRLFHSGIRWGHHMSKGKRSFKHKGYIFYKCNLENKVGIDEIFKKEQPQVVCHLAAQAGVRYSIENPDAYIKSNLIGFQNIIEACRAFNIKNFSYASSSSVYGGNQSLPFSENDRVDNPISLYAATKKSNELVAFTYSHLYGISTTGLRFFTVYGPWGRPDMALFLFVKAILSGESINVFNNGNMLRDFTYIDDIVEGIIRVIENPAQIPEETTVLNPTKAPYKIYNIGNNNPVKLMDFIYAIEKSLGKKFKINYLPIQPGDVSKTYANVDSLANELGYRPATPIKVGIDNFLNWYLEYYK